jgi:prolyl oligopeptidase
MREHLRLIALLSSLALAHVVTVSAAAAQPAGDSYDPYAFLIPQFGKKAIQWAQKQTDATRATLESSPAFRAVLADMQTVHARERPLPSYYLLGGRLFIRLERNKLHPYGRIAVADAGLGGLPGTWRTVFDLDSYNRTVPVPYAFKWITPEAECLAPSYHRCMIPLYYNGGQDNAYVEVDVRRGMLVKDGFHVAPGRNFVAWLDRDTLLVAHTTEGAPAHASQFPAELHLWRRGTPLSRAPVIFREDPSDSLFEFYVTGSPGERRIFLDVFKTYESFQLKELTSDGRATDLPLPRALGNLGTPEFSRGRVAVQLAEATTLRGRRYPADAIIAYDWQTDKVEPVMLPPKGVYLSGGFTGTRSGFAIVGVRNLQRILYLAVPKPGGWSVRERRVEDPGIVLRASSDEESDALLLREEGLVTPPRYSVLNGSRAVVIDRATPEADLRQYTVNIRHARSRDGTVIDYYLMHKVGQRTGPTPTILQGYGGFGISDDPSYFCCHFGAGWKAWFDRGGAFAVAAIRGGGERGAEWHLAATGMHKIRSFEDFDAVAEALEHSGFTDAAHLGAIGHSEGGELTAVVTVMRPDLYAAAVIGAPTTDNSIIGHGDGGISAGMASEEGDWDVSAERRYMQVWDPYSNIRRGVTYPKTLCVVATTDNQVGPSHCRRFVAKMHSVGAHTMLLEGFKGGHDYPDEYTQTDDTAIQMSFLIDTLMGTAAR